MAATLITALEMYLIAGALVAVAFLGFGIGRLDENATGVWVFRPILIPGILLIWPLVALRWWRLATGRADEQRRYLPPLRTQRWLTLALAIAVPLIITAALLQRQDPDLRPAAVQLEPPG